MSVTAAISFPLGRYHATPWDRSVNEGVVEWPPSPWRLLRALVSTWYIRWPDLPAPVLDGLLQALGDPPSYWTPPAEPGHTRHYLPTAGHTTGSTGGTELALDPFLRLPRSAELLVRWDGELDGEQRAVLAELLELVPYLGRAESVCRARLLDAEPVPDGAWWRPSPDGAGPVRLLAPQAPVRRPVLELSTVELRQGRRTVPPESRWVAYRRATPTAPGAQLPEAPTGVEAVRCSRTRRCWPATGS